MGVVDLVIKVYFRGVNEKFPDGGVMSQHMETLKLGDKVKPTRQACRLCSRPPQLTFEGPKGRFTYKKRGVFAIKQLPSQASNHATMQQGPQAADAVRRAAARSCARASMWG